MNVIWLVQLGTPQDPSVKAVRQYLDEFLMDPDVINLPSFLRALLVKGFIVPFRAPKSAEAYQSIWMKEGSPLLVHSKNLAESLQQDLGQDYRVVLGMRYGEPSLPSCWEKIKSLEPKKLLLVPLFPQFAKATTGSISKRVIEVMTKSPYSVEMKMLSYFYDQEAYLEALAKTAGPFDLNSYDHILFSYHGLPKKQIEEVDSHCLITDGCCDQIKERNEFCYRAHCLATTRQLAKRLQLQDSLYSTSFQSRLGPVEWIRPYTDQELIRLAKERKKRILIFSPAFVADCLETLEEISIQGTRLFKENGGETLELVPSLNAEPYWISALSDMIKEQLEQMDRELCQH